MRGRRGAAWRGPVALVALALLAATLDPSGLDARRQHAGTFAATIAALSEDGGYFDTDNLISNERSYAEPMPALDAEGLAGGVYIGVGPDQNFSYIARLRPSTAYLVDIRRDNLLLHLLFKAMFELADTRAEYVCLLVGCTVPAERRASLAAAGPVELAAWVDAARREGTAAPDPRLAGLVERFGVPLSSEDRAAIGRFHRSFLDDGLDLKFHSFGRPPQRLYPAYRDLMIERDPSGAFAHFLASERAFTIVRDLERHDRLIPLVGDLAGSVTLPALARKVSTDGERVAAVYVSNVEYYLVGGGRFEGFTANLARLPRHPGAVLLRAIFQTAGGLVRPGYGSTSVALPVEALLRAQRDGGVRSYGDLIRAPR